MNRITPDTDRKTFGDWSYLAIASYHQKIRKYQKPVLKDQDPEALHQMRVGMRRLRSALTGFQLAVVVPKPLGDRSVGQLGKILGQLRDLDVLGEALTQTYQPLLTTREREVMGVVWQYYGNQRQRAFKRVKNTLKGKAYKQFCRAGEKWLGSPQFTVWGQQEIEPILPDLLLPTLGEFLLHPGWWVGQPVGISGDQGRSSAMAILQSQGHQLHDLRKLAKKNRYNLDLFSRFYGEEYGQCVAKIKQIQSVVGEIQDCQVLQAFLVEVLGDRLPLVLPTFMEIFTEITEAKWEEWLELRDYFLDPQRRSQLRQVIENPQSLGEI